VFNEVCKLKAAHNYRVSISERIQQQVSSTHSRGKCSPSHPIQTRSGGSSPEGSRRRFIIAHVCLADANYVGLLLIIDPAP
jgi:hypothetical protein